MLGFAVDQLVIMTIGTIYIMFWVVIFIKGRKREAFFRPVTNDDFPMSEIFFVGYELLSMVHYSYRSEKLLDLKKKLGIIYEEKYADYYLRVVQCQRVTIASVMIGIGFVFYGLLSDVVVLIVMTLMAGVAYYYYGNDVDQKISKRSEELLTDFSEIVSELALLINAGMVMREAWETVAGKGKSLIYLEMQRVVEEIKNGTAERDAYYDFGVRCIIPEIKKFTSTILQGMSKGNQELGKMLQEQSAEIWKQKKSQVEQMAQMAGTKLIFPMCIMFLGIIILVVVPIFSNIGV